MRCRGRGWPPPRPRARRRASGHRGSSRDRDPGAAEDPPGRARSPSRRPPWHRASSPASGRRTPARSASSTGSAPGPPPFQPPRRRDELRRTTPRAPRAVPRPARSSDRVPPPSRHLLERPPDRSAPAERRTGRPGGRGAGAAWTALCAASRALSLSPWTTAVIVWSASACGSFGASCNARSISGAASSVRPTASSKWAR